VGRYLGFAFGGLSSYNDAWEKAQERGSQNVENVRKPKFGLSVGEGFDLSSLEKDLRVGMRVYRSKGV